MTIKTANMTATTPENKKNGRKRAIIAFGGLLGVAALATGAAFTDFANLNLGSGGFGSDSVYNIQVVGTDPVTGEIAPGSWQEANTAEGAPIAIEGSESLFPGSDQITVVIPVRNASTSVASSLDVKLAKIADTVPNVTDPTYLAQLRFDVAMPATARSATPISVVGQTFEELSSLILNELDALEESAVTVKVAVISTGTQAGDNALNGKRAFLQAQFNGMSIN